MLAASLYHEEIDCVIVVSSHLIVSCDCSEKLCDIHRCM